MTDISATCRSCGWCWDYAKPDESTLGYRICMSSGTDRPEPHGSRGQRLSTDGCQTWCQRGDCSNCLYGIAASSDPETGYTCNAMEGPPIVGNCPHGMCGEWVVRPWPCDTKNAERDANATTPQETSEPTDSQPE